ncbi:hypothetical protein QAD02_020617 [Eretmocerus hayati]|uniref:Uncharacterized protein n=1 Tax=Eretmocerus hayati TaxID=131215 RepID=A0ACC2PNE2_9HYME|nr:hypothetical protein QAD02_020617 [Eretmocerus hayati]
MKSTDLTVATGIVVYSDLQCIPCEECESWQKAACEPVAFTPVATLRNHPCECSLQSITAFPVQLQVYSSKPTSTYSEFEGWLLEHSSQSIIPSALPPGQTPLDSLGAPGVEMACRVPKCSPPLGALVFEGWLLEHSSQSIIPSALLPGQTPLDSLGAPGVEMACRVPKCSPPLGALVVRRLGPSKYTPASHLFLYPPGGALSWP